jgi:hypothetical protein
MDRASGFIASDQLTIRGKDSRPWAKCQKALGIRFAADRAIYNAFVRGDSTQSTVMVSVHWTESDSKGDPERFECETTNVRENELEAAIKARAERQ